MFTSWVLPGGGREGPKEGAESGQSQTKILGHHLTSEQGLLLDVQDLPEIWGKGPGEPFQVDLAAAFSEGIEGSRVFLPEPWRIVRRRAHPNPLNHFDGIQFPVMQQEHTFPHEIPDVLSRDPKPPGHFGLRDKFLLLFLHFVTSCSKVRNPKRSYLTGKAFIQAICGILYGTK